MFTAFDQFSPVVGHILTAILSLLVPAAIYGLTKLVRYLLTPRPLSRIAQQVLALLATVDPSRFFLLEPKRDARLHISCRACDLPSGDRLVLDVNGPVLLPSNPKELPINLTDNISSAETSKILKASRALFARIEASEHARKSQQTEEVLQRILKDRVLPLEEMYDLSILNSPPYQKVTPDQPGPVHGTDYKKY